MRDRGSRLVYEFMVVSSLEFKRVQLCKFTGVQVGSSLNVQLYLVRYDASISNFKSIVKLFFPNADLFD